MLPKIEIFINCKNQAVISFLSSNGFEEATINKKTSDVYGDHM